MGQSRHHYEQALEAHLRARRIPYISVNEARRTLLPPDAELSIADPASDSGRRVMLKSFDFVLYGEPTNLLIDVKGRKVKGRAGGAGRLESWVTQDDIDALGRWERLFGEGFRAAFVFIYWCQDQPPDALFQEIFEHQGRWYAVRSVLLGAYRAEMVPRSRRWGTVHVPTAAYERIHSPLTASPSREFRTGTGAETGAGGGFDGARFAPALAAR